MAQGDTFKHFQSLLFIVASIIAEWFWACRDRQSVFMCEMAEIEVWVWDHMCLYVLYRGMCVSSHVLSVWSFLQKDWYVKVKSWGAFWVTQLWTIKMILSREFTLMSFQTHKTLINADDLKCIWEIYLPLLKDLRNQNFNDSTTS